MLCLPRTRGSRTPGCYLRVFSVLNFRRRDRDVGHGKKSLDDHYTFFLLQQSGRLGTVQDLDQEDLGRSWGRNVRPELTIGPHWNTHHRRRTPGGPRIVKDPGDWVPTYRRTPLTVREGVQVYMDPVIQILVVTKRRPVNPTSPLP